MNETDDNEIIVVEDAPPTRRIHPAAFVAAGVVAFGLLVPLGWYLLGSRGDAGKPVPAPRSSMDDTTPQATGNQTLTLTPEQLQNAGVTIETVGEQLRSEEHTSELQSH